jgi:hypothetical protein
MSLARIAAKEINLIKSQRTALALILFYPIVVIIALGMAFGTGEIIEDIDVSVYMPDNIRGFDSTELMKKMEGTNRLVIHRFDSEAEVVEAIKKKS